MMTIPKANVVEQAAVHWNAGKPMLTGQLIYESLSDEDRPKWAANILRLVINKAGIQHHAIDRILNTADRKGQWSDAHRVFSSLRDSTLKLESVEKAHGLNEDQKLLRYVLSLAELVAKVTYNATKPPDEFDEDSGWWVAVSLRGFVDLWNDDGFAETAWSAIRCAER